MTCSGVLRSESMAFTSAPHSISMRAVSAHGNLKAEDETTPCRCCQSGGAGDVLAHVVRVEVVDRRVRVAAQVQQGLAVAQRQLELVQREHEPADAEDLLLRAVAQQLR